MDTRQLSSDGPKVSEIGFGGWAIGGGWGGTNDAESIRALNVAIDRGVNLIDTAEGYGDGHGERVIADVLKSRAEPLFVATKTPPAAGPWPPSPYCRWQDRYSAAYLRDNVNARLRNLGIDRIDLLQLHTWTRAWNDDPQPLLVLRQLRDEGKIGLIGVSTPEQDQDCVIQLMRNGLVDVVQVIFNLFNQDAAAQILPVAAETGTGVIVRVALDEGALAGKYAADHLFAEDDFRHRYFAGDRMSRTVERVDQIREDVVAFGLADDYTLADVALKFALSRPEVSTVIAGMRTVEQVEQNTRTSQLRDLPPEMLTRLRRHNWRRGVWYSGK
ncbi:aldo/keto reductase [Novipirellula artificiosorum]|uniref:General stress protein 69 n=1 Tax=Novipirellula artificiosorum TaxID=2528016 RepID=A0A5C6E4D0_9BACT|nr:aldo/keto reductase [Novipirellula artificiosorum]TWU42847.1 General stress protein 69 [Novipirellula artificiosorum]